MKKILQLSLLPVLFVGVFAAYLFSSTEYAKSVRPPSGDVHLTEFLNSGRPIYSIEETVIDGEVYTMVTGRISRKNLAALALPSGPPAYVFNGQQILVDWSHDTGDDSRFVKKWVTQKVWIKKETH